MFQDILKLKLIFWDSESLKRIFIAGKRSCLGESLARISSFLLFVGLVQKFKFSLPPDDPLPETEGKLGVTLIPPHHRIIPTPRI